VIVNICTEVFNASWIFELENNK